MWFYPLLRTKQSSHSLSFQKLLIAFIGALCFLQFNLGASSFLLPSTPPTRQRLINAYGYFQNQNEYLKRTGSELWASTKQGQARRRKSRTWHENLQKLKEYKETHGDCNVPHRYKDDTRLASFVNYYRRTAREGTITEERRTQLDALGFVWDPREQSFQQMLKKLKQYKALNGHCNVPQTFKDDTRLAVFVRDIRHKARKGTINKEQRTQLDALGFVWDPREQGFQQMLNKLKQYKALNGHCNVPQTYKEDAKLAFFVTRQRQKARKGTIIKEQRTRLDALGFIWDGMNAVEERNTELWNTMFQQLKEYKKEHGDCDVPAGFKENCSLALWVVSQRRSRALLTQSQRTKLDKLGFTWEELNRKRNDQIWDDRFEQLKKFHRTNGHTRVPNNWGRDPQLGRWVSTQRTQYRQGFLRKDRQAKLETINFTWRVRDRDPGDYEKLDKKWLKTYKKLKQFKTKHNHTNVPRHYEEGPELGYWVITQRTRYREGTLRKNREAWLNEIGFVWEYQEPTQKHQWLSHYQDLVVFKNEQGHLRVPRASPLYSWVRSQRFQHANGKLAPLRKTMLDELDFAWSVKA